MPGKRINELPALSGAGSANDDSVLIFDTSLGVTKRILRSQLAEGMVPDLPLQYYLGVRTSNPTLRVNGDALQLGDYYLDSVTKYTTVYNGSGWNSYASVIAAQAAAEAARDAAQLAETNAETAETNAETAAATATTQAGIATVQATAAASSATTANSAKTEAEAARDAALIQSGVYATEAAGRAAVADGEAFKVQGSGDVAAYEYRRTNSTTSVLIATYPSSAFASRSVYEQLLGDGTTTETYLQRKTATDVLTKTNWQGQQTLYTTARTNLISNSENIGAWTLASGVVVTADAALAPDGTMTADLVDWTAAALSSGFYRQSFSATPGLPAVNSIYLKGFSGGETIQLVDAATGGSFPQHVLTTEWKQYTIAFTPSGIGIGTWVQKVSGSKIYAWGGESKHGPLSSYIKTTSTAASVTDYSVGAGDKITLATAPAIGESVQFVPLLGTTLSAQDIGTVTSAATVKATPIDADSVGLSDSAAGNILKKLSWSNLKASLKTYLDTLYIKVNQSGVLNTDIFRIDDSKTKVIVGTTTGSGGTGTNLTAMGYGVLVANTTGYDNTVMGALAMRFNTTGSGCTAIGNQAGYANTTSYYITAFGDAALRNSTGERNHAFGAYAGNGITTGQDNLFLGWSSGRRQTTISNALIIDNVWRATAAEELSKGLIVGNFDASEINQWLRVNGKLKLNGDIEMLAGAKLLNVAQPTGTPPAATDLATALTLVNSLRSSLLSLGLIT